MRNDYLYSVEVVYFDTVAFGGTDLWANFLYWHSSLTAAKQPCSQSEWKGAAAGVGNLPYHFDLIATVWLWWKVLVATEGNTFTDFRLGYSTRLIPEGVLFFLTPGDKVCMLHRGWWQQTSFVGHARFRRCTSIHVFCPFFFLDGSPLIFVRAQVKRFFYWWFRVM